MDLIYGGAGNDELTGGSGADVFIFVRNENDDVITDFEVDFDLIDTSTPGISVNAICHDGDSIVVDFGSRGEVTLESILLEDLSADHFTYVSPSIFDFG